VPSHLADHALFDFKGLHVGTDLTQMDGGDRVFDAQQAGAAFSLPEVFPSQVIGMRSANDGLLL